MRVPSLRLPGRYAYGNVPVRRRCSDGERDNADVIAVDAGDGVPARPAVLRGRCMARPRAGLLRSIQRRDGRVGWTEVGLSVLRSVVRPDGLVDEPGESGGGEQGEEKAARGPPGGRARGLGGMLAVAEERPPARREIDASRSGARVMVLAAGLRTLLPEPARGAY